MHALRKDKSAEKVEMDDFKVALKEVSPSVTPDMEKWYKDFSKHFRQIKKTSTPVA